MVWIAILSCRGRSGSCISNLIEIFPHLVIEIVPHLVIPLHDSHPHPCMTFTLTPACLSLQETTDENAEGDSPPSPVGGVPAESGGGEVNGAENGDEAKQEGGGDAEEETDNSPLEQVRRLPVSRATDL